MSSRGARTDSVRIKVCGLMGPTDADAVLAAEADYAGVVLWEGSRRCVGAGQACAIHERLAGRVPLVGVFVDEDAERVAALLADGTIDVAQLHGSEDEAYIVRLRVLAPGCVVWKAFVVRGAQDLEAARRSSADLVLLDNGRGTGEAFDWSLAADLGRPFLLAGGLSPENLPEAIDLTHPWGVDLSSGVETDGVKDPARILAAVRTAHGRTLPSAPAHDEPSTTTEHHPSERSTMPETTDMPARFGIHGGQYIPETLMNAVIELEAAYKRYKDDPAFNAELKELLDGYAGRPSRLTLAKRVTADLGGAKVYLKREDMNHTGAHKINNALGQALLAQPMGKTRP
ncbi:MAG: hypothetical protein PHY60_03365, partial [Atopobiaceae bacterium]|nr:hypothetical protein [Atopobiaceae bacterium]